MFSIYYSYTFYFTYSFLLLHFYLHLLSSFSNPNLFQSPKCPYGKDGYYKIITNKQVWLIYDFLLRDKWEKLSVGSWKLMVCQTKIYYLLSKPFWGIKEAAEAR